MQPNEPNGQQSAVRFLEANHAKLMRIFDTVSAMVADGEVERAEVHAQDLIIELALCMRAEEEFLLPAFARRAELADLCARMRPEHAAIGDALKGLEQSFQTGTSSKVAAALSQLAGLLGAHHANEVGPFAEQVDRLLSDEEKRSLIRLLAHG